MCLAHECERLVFTLCRLNIEKYSLNLTLEDYDGLDYYTQFRLS